jgi:hypothetical protein
MNPGNRCWPARRECRPWHPYRLTPSRAEGVPRPGGRVGRRGWGLGAAPTPCAPPGYTIRILG